MGEVKALYSYKAAAHSELSFNAGDILTVQSKDPDNGWFSAHNTRSGWSGYVPSSYVEVVPDHASDQRYTNESIEDKEGMKNLKYLGSCVYNGQISLVPQKQNNLEIIRSAYGFPLHTYEKEYTVLLVGATKCGKSTLIDFIANFFMGIDSPKNNRIIRITEYTKDDKEFLFYTFCTSAKIAFTFVDSPSINNQKGFIDQNRRQYFANCMTKMKQNGIKFDAVGFVVQNHFVRLGPAEESMLKFVTGLLGEGNLRLIIPFITYADANTPPVIDALRKYGITTDKYIVFNNVCLNPSIKGISDLNELYWDDGLENIQKGLEIIMNIQPSDSSNKHHGYIEKTNFQEPEYMNDNNMHHETQHWIKSQGTQSFDSHTRGSTHAPPYSMQHYGTNPSQYMKNNNKHQETQHWIKGQGAQSFDSHISGSTYAPSHSMPNSAHKQSTEYINNNNRHQKKQHCIKDQGAESFDSHISGSTNAPPYSMPNSAHKQSPDRRIENEQKVEDLKYLGSCENFENTSPGPKRKRYFGYPSENIKEEFTVLLVGANKSGKSTLIDFINNFFLGMRSPKNKYPNVTNSNREKGAFCTYTYCTDDNTGFTFIDSPCINNSSGLIDKESKLNFCLSIIDMMNNGLKINALGFVVQNHFVRLGPAEESILKFVTGLLGEDNLHHLVPFITYADADTPPVLHALRRFGIRTDRYLVFNNVCVNIRPSRINKLSEMYWENGLKNIQKGLDIVMTLKKVKLKVEINCTEPDNEDFNKIKGGQQGVQGQHGESSNNKKSRKKGNTFGGRSSKTANKGDSRHLFDGGSLRLNKKNNALGTSTSESKDSSNKDKDVGSKSKSKKSSKEPCTIL